VERLVLRSAATLPALSREAWAEEIQLRERPRTALVVVLAVVQAYLPLPIAALTETRVAAQMVNLTLVVAVVLVLLALTLQALAQLQPLAMVAMVRRLVSRELLSLTLAAVAVQQTNILLIVGTQKGWVVQVAAAMVMTRLTRLRLPLAQVVLTD